MKDIDQKTVLEGIIEKIKLQIIDANNKIKTNQNEVLELSMQNSFKYPECSESFDLEKLKRVHKIDLENLRIEVLGTIKYENVFKEKPIIFIISCLSIYLEGIGYDEIKIKQELLFETYVTDNKYL